MPKGAVLFSATQNLFASFTSLAAALVESRTWVYSLTQWLSHWNQSTGIKKKLVCWVFFVFGVAEII